MITNIVSYYDVNKHRNKSESFLNKLQEKRLQQLLIYINENIPFYQNYFRGLQYDPKSDFSGITDLKLLPVINKGTFKQHGYHSFLSKAYNVSNLKVDYSSGSTGEPFMVYRDQQYYSYQLTNFIKAMKDNGYSFTDKILSFSAPNRLNTGKTILNRFGLLRRLPIDYNLPAGKALEIVLNYRPEVMFGNPSSFDMLGIEMKRQKIKIDFVKLIFAGGASITNGSLELCKDRFGIEMQEYYGAIEFGTLAYTKKGEEDYVLCQDQAIYEFLDENDNDVNVGDKARVVVTSLMSKAMPFVRYDIGDLAETKIVKNAYGENSLTIKKIIGRDNDIIQFVNGKIIAYQHFHSIMNLYTGVSQFKVIQKKVDYFEILMVVISIDYFNSIESSITKKLDTLFSLQAMYVINVVNQIPNDKGGKIKTFVTLQNYRYT